MDLSPEHAAEYTKRERVRFFAVSVVLGGAALVGARLWLFPWLGDFASNAHCRVVLGIPGTTALWYGLFFLFPLSVAAVLAGTFGRRGLKVLRQAQFPPAGEKVFRPTLIRRGAQARLIGYAHLLLVLLPVVLALWGLGQARSFEKTFSPSPGNCAADHSYTPTPLRGAA
jgi:hypothetical protein